MNKLVISMLSLFQVDFGDVYIPSDLKVPKLQVLPEFSRLAHDLRSGNISILDSKTIYIPNLHYDGGGPDAYFWVGNGSEPSHFGIKVPNEVGRSVKTHKYFKIIDKTTYVKLISIELLKFDS